MKTTGFFGLATAAILGATMTLVAQDAEEASAPSPEAMARMAPGPMHAKLEPLIGSWHMSGKYRMTPDSPWEEFEADVEREWIMGKRFVEETVESEFMGQPFKGRGIIGYDNTREEFTTVWIENMSTGTWVTTGELQGDKLVFEGENSNCMTGEKNCWGKSVLDLKTNVYKGFGKDKSGKEFQNMEMTAARH
jgi:hypothetical protein